jgi:hypothetical protein
MYRPLFCLLICLSLGMLLASDRPEAAPSSEPSARRADSNEPLPADTPVAFLEKCLERYDRDGVQGYSLIMHKQERVSGKLQPSEEMQIHFREKPFSVFMHWMSGASRADRVLYVEGKNNNQMLVHPSGIAGTFVKVVTRDPEGAEARQSGRYGIKDFGLKKTLGRTLHDWKAARDEGTLEAKYLGVKDIAELDDRPCYILRRTVANPKDNGAAQVTIYIDKETWFQTGSVLKDKEGKLLGEYLYHDIKVNPQFKASQFERAALTQ